MSSVRKDGTFVIERNGMPYHVTKGDPLFASVLEDYNLDPSAYSIEENKTPLVTHNDEIKDKILEIEATITQRRMREALLGTDNGWLKNADSQIAALREQLT